jgi:hypothetical protein
LKGVSKIIMKEYLSTIKKPYSPSCQHIKKLTKFSISPLQQRFKGYFICDTTAWWWAEKERNRRVNVALLVVRPADDEISLDEPVCGV